MLGGGSVFYWAMGACPPFRRFLKIKELKVHFWWSSERQRVTNARGVWVHARPGDF